MLKTVFPLLQFSVLGVLLLTAIGCGSSPAALPEPLGAATGKNTFILFYTEN